MPKGFEWGVLEFIRTGLMKKCIVMCDLRQYFLEVVVMHRTQMSSVNVMKCV